MSPRLRLAVVLSVVYIDMLGIGLAFPVLPRLIEQFQGGNVSQAARLAKRNRTDFYKLLSRHQLTPEDFKGR